MDPAGRVPAALVAEEIWTTRAATTNEGELRPRKGEGKRGRTYSGGELSKDVSSLKKGESSRSGRLGGDGGEEGGLSERRTKEERKVNFEKLETRKRKEQREKTHSSILQPRNDAESINLSLGESVSPRSRSSTRDESTEGEESRDEGGEGGEDHT